MSGGNDEVIVFLSQGSVKSKKWVTHANDLAGSFLSSLGTCQNCFVVPIQWVGQTVGKVYDWNSKVVTSSGLNEIDPAVNMLSMWTPLSLRQDVLILPHYS